MAATININYIIENADQIWNGLRWKEGIHCPECDCEEYYRLGDGRYKCKDCGRIFSDTTGTLLHHSKVEKWKWLWCIWKMSTGKGLSNIELSKDLGVNVKTAWMMQQKVRLLMEEKDIKLEGIVCIDELHVGGWQGMHFGKKWKYMKENHFIPNNSSWYNKKDILAASSKKKEIVIGMVDGKGRTRLVHVPNPVNKDLIKQVLDRYTNGPEMLVSDESSLYKHLGLRVEQSNHSKGWFMSKGGYTSNPVENRFSWAKRKIQGIYTHTSQKYLQLYLNQIAWSASHKDEGPMERFEDLLYTCTRAHVRTKDVLTYEPFLDWAYEDVYGKELELANEILDECSIIEAIETKHKVKVYR